MEKRRANAEAAVGVINYLLRYIQHGDLRVKGGATPARAFHFMWALTKDIPGRRGKIVEGKSPSARTLAAKWRQFERSAIFIYLSERHGFSQSLIPIDDDEFVPILLKQSEQIEELRHYFGAYAYIAEILEAAGGEPPFVTVPDTIDRVPVSTAPFSDAELRIIGDYKEDKPIIDTRLEPDDLGSSKRFLAAKRGARATSILSLVAIVIVRRWWDSSGYRHLAKAASATASRGKS